MLHNMLPVASLITAMVLVQVSCKDDKGTDEKSAATGAGNGGAGGGAYATTFVPGAIALTFPSSVSSSSTNAGLRLFDDSMGGGGSTGLSQLKQAIFQVQQQMAEVKGYSLFAEAVVTASSQCIKESSSTGATFVSDCAIPSPCTTFTKAMAADVAAQLGSASEEGGMSPTFSSFPVAGERVCFHRLTVSRLMGDPEFAQRFELQVDAAGTNSVIMFWSDGGQKVKTIQKFSFDMSSMGPAPTSSANGTPNDSGIKVLGGALFTYDRNLRLFTASRTFTTSGGEGMNSEYEQTITAQSLSNKLDLKGVAIKASLSMKMEGMDWKSVLSGTADDVGGFVSDESSSSQVVINSITLNGFCDIGKHYTIYPGNASTSDINLDSSWQKAMGGFYCSSNPPASMDIYFHGVIPPNPQAVRFFIIHWNADYSAIASATDGNFAIDTLDSTRVTTYNCREEAFTDGATVMERYGDGRCSEIGDWFVTSWDPSNPYLLESNGYEFDEIRVDVLGISEQQLLNTSGFG